jgi:hypothetical protein
MALFSKWSGNTSRITAAACFVEYLVDGAGKLRSPDACVDGFFHVVPFGKHSVSPMRIIDFVLASFAFSNA